MFFRFILMGFFSFLFSSPILAKKLRGSDFRVISFEVETKTEKTHYFVTQDRMIVFPYKRSKRIGGFGLFARWRKHANHFIPAPPRDFPIGKYENFFYPIPQDPNVTSSVCERSEDKAESSEKVILYMKELLTYHRVFLPEMDSSKQYFEEKSPIYPVFKIDVYGRNKILVEYFNIEKLKEGTIQPGVSEYRLKQNTAEVKNIRIAGEAERELADYCRRQKPKREEL